MSSEIRWLESYSGQTTDELLALEGTYRTDSIVLAFEQALGQKDSKRGYNFLSPEEIVVLAVESLEREVNNGGYGQFFANTPEFTPFILNSLNWIGCINTAALTQEAINALAIAGLPDNGAVHQAMRRDDAERDRILDACTDKYFSDASDLASPLLDFIKRHRTKIVVP